MSVQFVSDLPGLPGLRHFTLDPLDPTGTLCALRSLEAEGMRLVVAPSVAFFPAYAPEVDDEWAELLGLADATDAVVLLILTVGTSAATTTANLRAPIVLNRRTHAAAQVVLADEHPLRAPLPVSR